VELVQPDEVGELATTAPVHHMAGSGDEAVKRHAPVDDDFGVSGARIVHQAPPDSQRPLTMPELLTPLAYARETRSRGNIPVEKSGGRGQLPLTKLIRRRPERTTRCSDMVISDMWP
jgi:hypothetical protein